MAINHDSLSDYEMLRRQGDYLFNDREITDVMLFGRSVLVDKNALGRQGKVYVGEQAVRTALAPYASAITDWSEARSTLGRHLESNALVWGVSGFASPGFRYAIEADALSQVYEHLAGDDDLPGMVIDGAVSAGNLGLNGVIAASHGVTSVGAIPLKGLDSLAPRDHLVVYGDRYKDREIIVGTVPDVLICVGGGEGTRRERDFAIEHGSAILQLALNGYDTRSLPRGLVVCREVENIPGAVDTVRDMVDRRRRGQRRVALDQILQ